MAIHTALPIYKPAFDLLCIVTEYAGRMPRNVKPVVGRNVCDLCLDISTLIFDANCAIDKAPFIEELQRKKVRLETLLRVCQNLEYISKPQYAKAVAYTTSIGKQATGWRGKRHAPVT